MFEIKSDEAYRQRLFREYRALLRNKGESDLSDEQLEIYIQKSRLQMALTTMISGGLLMLAVWAFFYLSR